MPELPEVETVRRSLEKYCIGRTVESVWRSTARMRLGSRRSDLRALTGQSLLRVERRAKFLLLRWSGEQTLLVHLGMTGTLRLAAAGEPARKHDHFHLQFTAGERLVFNDARRFGLYELIASAATGASRHLRGLGVEPLDDAFTGELLFRLSRKRGVALKLWLMNPAVVVGVGNIYASESLFRASLSPRRRAAGLRRAEADALAAAVREVLGEAIKAGGTTLRDFAAPDGERGYFRIQLEVYDRAGEPCRRCAVQVKRIVQGGRSTFFCPSCQH
jgi:formamidopyrimidine-DNA glycosylase